MLRTEIPLDYQPDLDIIYACIMNVATSCNEKCVLFILVLISRWIANGCTIKWDCYLIKGRHNSFVLLARYNNLSWYSSTTVSFCTSPTTDILFLGCLHKYLLPPSLLLLSGLQFSIKLLRLTKRTQLLHAHKSY